MPLGFVPAALGESGRGEAGFRLVRNPGY